MALSDAPFCVVPPYIWSERDKLRAGSKTVCNEEFALGSQAIDLQGRLLLLVSFLAEARKVHVSFALKEKAYLLPFSFCEKKRGTKEKLQAISICPQKSHIIFTRGGKHRF